ncbi:MAG: NUDIX domain-containing protein [Oscillospiraceae bacterium]|jgi:8-oxo-dGTP diphosphatase|nr:NUDIX domain-containing protein [Oscillospiraceae bacterium]
MQGLNIIWVFNPTSDKVLFCKRRKEPYKGLYNLVGGKIKQDEDGLDAAYRELHEETSISDIELVHLMDFTYFIADANKYFSGNVCRVEACVGKLQQETDVHGDENELLWLDVSENFFDMSRFAGKGNIGHIYEMIKQNHLDD